MIILPDKCLRGYLNCEPLAQIEADNGDSFICCGLNDGSIREIEADRFTFCFKNLDTDEETYNDKRDLTHMLAVISQALAVDEEREC